MDCRFLMWPRRSNPRNLCMFIPAWDCFFRRACDFNKHAASVCSFFSASEVYFTRIWFHSVCLFYSHAEHFVSQQFRDDEEVGALEGLILWASVARLAANHLYERVGGRKRWGSWFLLDVCRGNDCGPDNTRNQRSTDCSLIDPQSRKSVSGRKKYTPWECFNISEYFSLGAYGDGQQVYTANSSICASSHVNTLENRSVYVVNLIAGVLPCLCGTRVNFTHGISCYNISLQQYGGSV